MKDKFSDSAIIILAIISIFIISKIGSSIGENKQNEFYLEHKEAIDTYNENHKDDWKEYQGTRRNSSAETESLKHQDMTLINIEKVMVINSA